MEVSSATVIEESEYKDNRYIYPLLHLLNSDVATTLITSEKDIEPFYDRFVVVCSKNYHFSNGSDMIVAYIRNIIHYWSNGGYGPDICKLITKEGCPRQKPLKGNCGCSECMFSVGCSSGVQFEYDTRVIKNPSATDLKLRLLTVEESRKVIAFIDDPKCSKEMRFCYDNGYEKALNYMQKLRDFAACKII